MLSGYQDASMPVGQGGGRLLIGPLYQNKTGSRYNGIASAGSFDLTGAYAAVQAVQVPSSATQANAMLTVLKDSSNHYRVYTEGGQLGFEVKVAGRKTLLGTIAYDPAAHAFWRIQHDPSSDQVLFQTAPDSGGVPGTWITRATTGRSVPLTAVRFELKAGTWKAEASPPGTAAFDHFRAARP